MITISVRRNSRNTSANYGPSNVQDGVLYIVCTTGNVLVKIRLLSRTNDYIGFLEGRRTGLVDTRTSIREIAAMGTHTQRLCPCIHQAIMLGMTPCS